MRKRSGFAGNSCFFRQIRQAYEALVWQLIFDHPIDEGAQGSAEDDHDKNPVAMAQHNKHGTGAGAQQCPAEAEDGACQQVAAHTQRYGFDVDSGIAQRAHTGAAHDGHGDGAHHDSSANDAIHVKALEAKHFVYAVPGDGLGLGHYDTEDDANQEKAK